MIKLFYFKQFILACHLFALSLNVKQLYLAHRSDSIRCSHSRSNGNEGVLCIPQSSYSTGASPLDCLVSYPGCSWG